jgi:hypothetical protein
MKVPCYEHSKLLTSKNSPTTTYVKSTGVDGDKKSLSEYINLINKLVQFNS